MSKKIVIDLLIVVLFNIVYLWDAPNLKIVLTVLSIQLPALACGFQAGKCGYLQMTTEQKEHFDRINKLDGENE